MSMYPSNAAIQCGAGGVPILSDLQKRRGVPITAVDPCTAFERHYAPAELAKIWRYNKSTIIRMFQDEPGVMKVGKENRRDGKRDYITMRIPESVVRRVYAKRV